MARIDAASELCALVFAGNLPLLKRYMQAGIEVWDYCLLPMCLSPMLPVACACQAAQLFQTDNVDRNKRSSRCGLSAQVDAGDYDKRTALHIAAVESNLSAVRPCCAI